MSQLRNSKNVQCAASSAVYIGLKAEHLHASDMHATRLHSDDGIDVFETLLQLQTEVKVLEARCSGDCCKILKTFRRILSQKKK